MTIRAISFDVDGTLYPVRRLRVAWRLRHARGLLVALVAAREKLRHEAAPLDGAALRRREAELVAPSFDWSIKDTEARIAEVLAVLPEALTRGVRPFRGVRSALEAALARGIEIVALSDYRPDEKLAHLGLDDLAWSARVGADELGALKPHGRSFDRVSELLGVPCTEILHIGDREELDIRGALDAGFRAWRFDRKAQGPTAAERVFTRWDLNLFAPLFGEADR